MRLSRKSVCLSSMGPEILASVSYCSANFQLTLDSLIPNFNYEHSENVKTGPLTTVVFNLNQTEELFSEHPADIINFT